MAGSGCTTLLKVLAGYDAGFEEIEGEVKFGDIPMDVMKKRYRGEVAFNGKFVVSASIDDSLLARLM
jgi:ABC-type multidrug transport system ATPase subunit